MWAVWTGWRRRRSRRNSARAVIARPASKNSAKKYRSIAQFIEWPLTRIILRLASRTRAGHSWAIRRHMPFRQTIAAKIFGLAIILLLLTIALAGFLLYEVTRTKQDLTVVANFDVPLTQSVARLDEFGLRRRLAFERWFGALNAAEPNREVLAEASENYSLFTRRTTDEFGTARRIIEAYPKNAPGSQTLAEVETLLNQIEPAYQILNNRQREVLDLQRAGQHDTANQRLNLLNDLQRTIQSQRQLVTSKMQAWSSSATKATERRERAVFW